MKLRNMNASVTKVGSITVEIGNGERVKIENAYVLTSYQSRVAIYSQNCGRVYLLPRHNYSSTTSSHVYAFVQDYCSTVSALEAKKRYAEAKRGLTDSDSQYVLCNGIVEGDHLASY